MAVKPSMFKWRICIIQPSLPYDRGLKKGKNMKYLLSREDFHCWFIFTSCSGDRIIIHYVVVMFLSLKQS